MDATQFTTALRSSYLKRDVLNIIKLVSEFKNSEHFPPLYHKLVKQEKLDPSSGKIEPLIRALLNEVETDIQENRRLSIDATFYDIADHFREKFNAQVSEIYIETQIPSDFIANIRSEHHVESNRKLTETLVTNYKHELIRLEKGRRSVLQVLQSASHFPLRNANRLSELLNDLHTQLRSDYKYLSAKPYFLAITAVSKPIDEGLSGPIEPAVRKTALLRFKQYNVSGQEPKIYQQVELQIAINRLYQFLKKQTLLPEQELARFWTEMSEILTYSGDASFSPKEWKVLQSLLTQINKDIAAISQKLVDTFIEEYHCAEEQMRLRHIIIQSELAFIGEYLDKLAISKEISEHADPEKIQVAMDKLHCLKDTFPISERQKESAAKHSFVDIERSALGVSTVISPSQLTDWIKIYSIIFSNTDYLAQFGKSVDFSIMRNHISSLTTYHLYDNIAQLKNIVERNLSTSSEEKSNQFQRFNEALKHKLAGLMGGHNNHELSLREMIDELGFLENKSVQFVIAETFKGFQHIVDAFNTSTTDYFVRDQDAMLKESRALYNQICNQSMKIFRTDSPKAKLSISSSTKSTRKSWLGRLFS
ncbi:MAG: hypothetical protein MI754_06090 [Chromatiales bacterium]|nr:hypothetical protein [Chromatiales bacterium]